MPLVRVGIHRHIHTRLCGSFLKTRTHLQLSIYNRKLTLLPSRSSDVFENDKSASKVIIDGFDWFYAIHLIHVNVSSAPYWPNLVCPSSMRCNLAHQSYTRIAPSMQPTLSMPPKRSFSGLGYTSGHNQRRSIGNGGRMRCQYHG